jgi:type VI secretion system secreted protein VgrG
VVGPAGQEIHTDEFGRVRVRFPWDRSGAPADTSSCWLRVSQPWAGAGFGWTTLPRVGHEVVVAFFEDDPDQPVILSGAYNGTHPAPFQLPSRGAAATWQSRSSPGGDGYNEVLLDDPSGKEQFYLQAEQDLSQLVRRNEASTTNRNVSKLVKGDETQTTGKQRLKIVAQDRRKRVNGDHTVRVEGSRATFARKRLDVTVDGSSHTEVGGDSDVSIHGAERALVGGTESRAAGGNAHEVTFEKHAIEVKGDVHLLSDDSGVIESFQTITLKVPGAFVFIDAGGIVIKGPLVLINSGGVAGSGGGATPTAPDPPRRVEPFEPPMPHGEPNPDGDVAPLPEAEDTPPPLPGVQLTWIEIVLRDAEGDPVGGERYQIVTPDGKKREGHLDAAGRAREDGIVPGECQVTFPDLAPDDWE